MQNIVEKCVLHHRGNWSGTRDTVEEQIIADADVIAHLYSIPSLFNLAYGKIGLSMEEGREFAKNKLIRDYNKLSRESQKDLKRRFDTIMKVLFIE